MKHRLPLMMGALAAFSPMMVSAQEMSGAVTLGIAQTSLPDGLPDLSTISLDGKLDVDYAGRLFFGANISTAKVDIDGISEDLSATTIGLTAGFPLGSMWNGGAYFEHAALDIDGFGTESINSYGLFVGYTSDLMAFEVFGGETDGDALSGTGVDWYDIGARASFAIGDRGEVGGHWINSRLSSGGFDVDLTSVGVGGSFEVAQGFSVFAGLNRSEIDVFVGDVTTFGLGVGYDMASVVNFPATVSLELVRSRLDDGVDNYDADSIRFGVTIPFGGAKSTPMNSIASSASSPNRTALTTAINSDF